jgi:hypothetical protein
VRHGVQHFGHGRGFHFVGAVRSGVKQAEHGMDGGTQPGLLCFLEKLEQHGDPFFHVEPLQLPDAPPADSGTLAISRPWTVMSAGWLSAKSRRRPACPWGRRPGSLG